MKMKKNVLHRLVRGTAVLGKSQWVLALLCIFSLISLSATPLFAGGILNKQNQSIDYFRTLTRNAATDAADIVVFNPAGVMQMKDGFYTKLDAMYIAKEYSNVVPGFGKFESTEPSIVPGFFSLYKQGPWAGFFSVTIPGGGGTVDFKNGNARTLALAGGIMRSSFLPSPPYPPGIAAFHQINDMYIKADSIDIGYSLGVAREINSKFSVSGGLRFVDASQEFKGDAVLSNPAPLTTVPVDLKRNAQGVGFFLGADVKPVEKLNLALTYFSNTELDYKSLVSEGNNIASAVGWANGTKQREDLPGLLGFGASYQVAPKLRVEADFTYYLESSATFGDTRFKDAGNSWDLAFSGEYTINEQWKASLGYMHTQINGMKSTDLLVEAPELDANTIGTGFVFSPTNQWQISFSLAKVWYDSVTTDVDSSRAPADSQLKKDVWAVGVGVQYRWF
jgi:long-chain fatty acid transport protein